MASSVFTASYASTNISQSEKLATVERNSLYMNLQDLQCFLNKSSIDVLYSVIRDLTNQSTEVGLVQSDIKILILSHNIPDRLYRQWMQRPVNLPVTLMMDASEMEPVEKVVPECLTLLLKLGNYIQQNPKKNITGPNHTVSEEIRHLIIKENTIKYLCGSSELMTPQRFLEYYEKSTYVVLDSGRFRIDQIPNVELDTFFILRNLTEQQAISLVQDINSPKKNQENLFGHLLFICFLGVNRFLLILFAIKQPASRQSLYKHI